MKNERDAVTVQFVKRSVLFQDTALSKHVSPTEEILCSSFTQSQIITNQVFNYEVILKVLFRSHSFLMGLA